MIERSRKVGETGIKRETLRGKERCSERGRDRKRGRDGHGDTT